MEIHLKPQSSILANINRFFNAFKEYDPEPVSYIMPMAQLEKNLHNHYVSMEKLELTFEYYDRHNQIQWTQLPAKIVSPVQKDRSILVQFGDDDTTYSLSLEQILTTSANVA